MVPQHTDPEQIPDHANICPTEGIEFTPFLSQSKTRLVTPITFEPNFLNLNLVTF